MQQLSTVKANGKSLMARQFDSDERLPGYPNYYLPAGIGLAYGVFAQGFFTYWPLEVVLFAFLWGLRGPLFKTWSYRAYATEGKKAGMRPAAAGFVVLQTVSTGILVFAVAFFVIWVRKLLASE